MVSNTYIVLCFCFVCFRLVYPMLPVFLDCSFLIAASVFSYVYFIMYIDILVLKLMQGQLPTETTGARGTDLQTPLFSNFLFTNLFSITFLYFFIISSLFPYFNLFVSISMQSYVNSNLHVSTLYSG